MSFSGFEFLFVFFPMFLVLYYLCGKKLSNAVFLLASLAFYIIGSWGNPAAITLLALSLLVNYSLGLLLSRANKAKKLLLILGIVFNFGFLVFYKYTSFIFQGLNTAFAEIFKISFTLPEVNLLMPIGISFYTFRAVSYICDVYSGKYLPEKSFVSFGAYFIGFTHITAGPIVRYGDMKETLDNKTITLDTVVEGIKLFMLGLGFKVLLANNIYGLWNKAIGIGFESVTTPFAWMSIIAYSLYIYFDFHGYSLMAVGIGKMLGYSLPQNFDHPYTSVTMTEFWRRWHITLGQWFRDYIYIPLGGNRCSAVRNIFNLLIVWLFTGIWHGAGANFILWGLFLFVIIVLEKFVWGKLFKKVRPLGHIYMIILIPLSWTFFAVSDMGELVALWTKLFPFFGGTEALHSNDYIEHGLPYIKYIVPALVCCLPMPEKLISRIPKWISDIVSMLFLLAVFAASVWFIGQGLNDPFLYGVF